MSFLYIKKSCNEILFRLKRLTFWHMFEELIKKNSMKEPNYWISKVSRNSEIHIVEGFRLEATFLAALEVLLHFFCANNNRV